MECRPADAMPSPVSGERAIQLPARASAAFTPFHIGPYCIIERIGDGGMGVVYLAEQDEPIQRRVTIKCIRHDLVDPESVRRFEFERQTLAAMTHPNIASIYDAGSSDDGRPYFVMEYVQGPSLSRYCFDKRLTIADRLRLMIAACEAVQYAHQNGVIHKDLKPENILVTDVHGRPTPKIIDFGIARAVDGSRAARGAVSWTDFVGTPQYMSPEQHGGPHRSVDTRTDIYSLGIVLYELLCGFLPDELQLAGAGVSQADGFRRLRPSEQVRRASVNVAENRRLRNNRALSRALHGDIDAVILKAIAADPADRYQTPLALASDLQRHLEHRPIGIHQDRRFYTLRKLVRRNLAASLTGAASVLALVILSAALALQLRSSEAARMQAEDAYRRYESLHEIIVQGFRMGAPGNAAQRDLSATGLLQKIAARLEDEALIDPEGRAPLLADAAVFYSGVGMHAQAEALSRRVVRTMTVALGESDVRTACAESRLAWILSTAGQYQEAHALLQKAIAIVHSEYGDSRQETLNAEINLAFTLIRMDDAAGGKSVAGHVIDNIRKHRLVDERIYAEALNALAEASSALGDFAGAETLYLEALVASKNLFGESHRHTHIIMNGLAYVRQSRGDPRGAEAIYRDELAYVSKTQGGESEDATTLASNLGFNLVEQERYEEAAGYFDGAYATLKKSHGDSHPRTLSVLLNLARARMHLGEPALARSLLMDVMRERQRIFGDDHPNVANAKSLIGQTWLMEKDYGEALRWQDAALHVYRDRLGEHWRTAIAGIHRAEALAGLGKLDEADAAFRDGFDLLDRLLGPGHPRRLALAAHVAAAHAERGDAGRAAKHRPDAKRQ